MSTKILKNSVCNINEEKILIQITGEDYPGILLNTTQILKKFNARILSIQQTTTLKQLSLSLLISVLTENGFNALKELRTFIKKEQLNFEFSILTTESKILYEENNIKYYALTILMDEINLAKLSMVLAILKEYSINIEQINQLANKKLNCIEFILNFSNTCTGSESVNKKTPDFLYIRRKLFNLAFKYNFDLGIQPENLYRRSKRLILLDMDSTLIKQEVIDEIAHCANLKEQVAEITEKTMNGEMDFKDSLLKRVQLLKGLSIKDLEKVLQNIQLTEGVESLIQVLKKLGYKIALVSGGFTYFTDHFQKKLNLDYSYANQLEMVNDKLTGNVQGNIIDGSMKATILKELAQKEGIPLDQVVAIGDGANDIQMIETAGLGIAFHAKPKLQKKAKAILNTSSMLSALFLLGLSQKEIFEINPNLLL